ncbi:hypothetical protein F4804DRAFT_301261 [Jackrogersella minutella]|nr:hypothetical protein F4804DRAFT_301261 [Jackrogersella minutella]
MPSLIQHPKHTKHCPCPRCDPLDIHEELLEARLSPIDHYPCPQCRRRFPQKQSLEAHQIQSLHAYCDECGIVSPTTLSHEEHIQCFHTPSSATQFRCCDCERDFKSESALADHLRTSKVHRKKKVRNNKKNTQEEQEEVDQVIKCKKCKKTFKTRHAQQQHLESVRHKPLSNIKCVADAECNKHFNCPSAQLHHLESGKCVSKMTKKKLNAAIAANDTGRIITSGGVTEQWLLGDNPSVASTSQIGSPIFTPTSSEFLDSYPPSAILTPTSTLSTSTDFHSLALRPGTQNGYQTCPLCPPSCTRRFKPEALQQHMFSSVHAKVSMSLPLPVPDEISFHCPRGLIGEQSTKATKQFSTVSGLAQHLESGACGGGKVTLKRVIEYVQEEMKGMGFGDLKLLR